MIWATQKGLVTGLEGDGGMLLASRPTPEDEAKKEQ